MQRVSDIGEFGLIQRLARQLKSRQIGDDCAVVPSGRGGECLLLACDPVVEGVHYRPGTPGRQVGWKALARNLSDIAAMGGTPRWALVSLGIRADTPVAFIDDLYRGLQRAAKRFDCEIVGGDTTHVRGAPFVVVTIVGSVPKRQLLRRRGAKPGDTVFVTGQLGGSQRGKHLRFTPRLAEARWLAEHVRVHALMDISDGLASDLQRLAEASRVGFAIDAAAIPRATTLRGALTDGEDFELLFTVSDATARRLPRRWPFSLRLTAIGHVTREHGILLDDQPLGAHGYDHFQQRR